MRSATPSTDLATCSRRSVRGPLAMAMMLAAAVVVGAIGQRAEAQTETSGPALSYEPALTIAAGSSKRLSVEVVAPQPVPSNTYLRLRGLPQGVTLSDGYRAGTGGWAVPLGALSNLTMTASAEARGQAEVGLALVTLDGTVLVEGRLALTLSAEADPMPVPRIAILVPQNVAPPPAPPVELPPAVVQQPPPPPPALTQPPSRAEPRPTPPVAALAQPVEPKPVPPAVTAPPPAPVITPENRQQIVRLQERGEAELREGNVATARLFFERAVALGSDRAALALAKSFDPFEMAGLGVVGLKPDAAMARRWYAHAKDLGATDADWRMARLARP